MMREQVTDTKLRTVRVVMEIELEDGDTGAWVLDAVSECIDRSIGETITKFATEVIGE